MQNANGVPVKLLERLSIVQAFKLPLWGQIADDTPPQWLIERIQSGELQINNKGGFSTLSPFGILSCIAGDIVLLHEDGIIEFCKPETFTQYTVIEPEALRSAA
jgi:hypothetical protein